MSRPKTLKYIGPKDRDGRPQEWFGATTEYEAIPARDLDADDTAALTEAQWQVLESENGKRLYGAGEKPSSTANPPKDTSAPTASG